MIGDCQTMAAEANVLRIPCVRFNDFVYRIGYLNDLENNYQLGYGIKPNNPGQLLDTVQSILSMPNRKEVFVQRHQKMLSEKIDTAAFLTWFIENYPQSVQTMKQNPEFQNKFR